LGSGGALALGEEPPFDFRLEALGLSHNRPVKSLTLGGGATKGGGNLQTAATMANLVWVPRIDVIPARP